VPFTACVVADDAEEADPADADEGTDADDDAAGTAAADEDAEVAAELVDELTAAGAPVLQAASRTLPVRAAARRYVRFMVNDSLRVGNVGKIGKIWWPNSGISTLIQWVMVTFFKLEG